MTRATLRALLWIASAGAFAWYLTLAWRSLASSMPADPAETLLLEHAARFARGDSPYVEPSRGGMPLMPLFPLLVSCLVRLFDVGIRETRGLALLASLLTAAAAGSIVRKETRSSTFGIAAAAHLLMSQSAIPLTARPEPLMLLFALLGAQALRGTAGRPGALLAALPFGAACFTHPAGLWFALAALLHLGVHDPRRATAYGLGLATLVCGAQLELSRAFGPWFNYFAWDAGAQALRFAPGALLRYAGSQILGTLGVFSLAMVLSFALPIRPWHGAVGIWTWLAFAGLAAGMLATQSRLGAGEAMRFAAVVLAILGPVSAVRITQHLSNWPGGSRTGGQTVVLAALALQFVTLFASAGTG